MRLFVALLLLVSCSLGYRVGSLLAHKRSSKVSVSTFARRRGCSSPLWGTSANPSAEKIDPAQYSKDLYGVLGMPRNASRVQLRNAYWDIAGRNHPDRNNTPQALEVFRNASYAYNVLARDQQLRASYNAKQNAKDIQSVIEGVTTGVLQPLAFGVAIPLLNFTVQSIGSFAVPFLQDALEQSNVLLRTAFVKKPDGGNAEGSRFDRAAQALRLLKIDQSIKRLGEEQLRFEKSALKMRATVAEYSETGAALSADCSKRNASVADLEQTRDQRTHIFEAAKFQFDSAKARKVCSAADCLTAEAVLTDLKGRVAKNEQGVQSTVGDIARLEEQLKALYATKAVLLADQSSMEQEVREREQSVAVMGDISANEKSQWAERKVEFDQAAALRAATMSELSLARSTARQAQSAYSEKEQASALLVEKIERVREKAQAVTSNIESLSRRRVAEAAGAAPADETKGVSTSTSDSVFTSSASVPTTTVVNNTPTPGTSNGFAPWSRRAQVVAQIDPPTPPEHDAVPVQETELDAISVADAKELFRQEGPGAVDAVDIAKNQLNHQDESGGSDNVLANNPTPEEQAKNASVAVNPLPNLMIE